MSSIYENSLLGDQEEVKKPAAQTGQQNRMANYSTGTPATQQGSGNVASLQKYVDANQGAGLNQANRLSDATNKDIKAFNDDNKAKTTSINEGADAARTLFDQNGTKYQEALANWQQGLNSMNSITDRQNFDPTAQQITAFTQGQTLQSATPTANPLNFQNFNTLRTGAGYDQQKYLDMLSQGMYTGKQTQAAIQQKANDIQTEEGRYRLLQQASSPYGNRASIGGNRLNQLLFQANPNAVKALQTQFQGQAGDVANQMAAFNQVGFDIVNPLIEQEENLQTALQTGATGLQNTFENKIGNDANYNIVNNARTGLYDKYVQQLKDNSLSTELTELLGLNNVATYNPYQTGGPQESVVPNQIRSYNALTDDASVKNYLIQNGDKADSLQDLLSANDWQNYQGLGALSGDTSLNASGASTLLPAVEAVKNNNTGNSALLDKILTDNTTFKGYLDDKYTYDYNDYSGYFPGDTMIRGSGDLNSYIQTNNPISQYQRFDNMVDLGAINSSEVPYWMKDAMNSGLQQQMNPIIESTGVKNTTALNQGTTLTPEQQLLKSLGLI